MVSTKPTEDYEWAEGTPPVIPGTNPPTDPGTSRRSSGFGNEEKLPHETFNWLFRTVGRWLGWLEDKVDNHVHDGGSNPESVDKIDLTDHIDYGTYAEITVEQDDVALHEIRYTHTVGVGEAVLYPDTLRADKIEFEAVWDTGSGTTTTLLQAQTDLSPGVDEQTITFAPKDAAVQVTYDFDGEVSADQFNGNGAARATLKRSAAGVITGFNGLNLTFTNTGSPVGSTVRITTSLPSTTAIIVTPHDTNACFATVFYDGVTSNFGIDFRDDTGARVVPSEGFSLIIP